MADSYLRLALDPANSSKFKGKNVEINFGKSLGELDLANDDYQNAVNNYLIGLDKNKKEIYID